MRAAPPRRVPRGFEPVETPFGTAWRLCDLVPAGRLRGPAPEAAHAYLDTETTGLSGGTGTQVFAAAVCRPTGVGLELTQLFLAEPSGEAAFLHLLQEELLRGQGVATYNGARFDLPLLRTRWIMARLPGELAHPAHTDLLTLTRALLRQRLPSCALRTVEERLLGFEREHDLPGSLAPEAYLAYRRHGWSTTLEPALAHNRQDALSLFHLHARLGLLLAGEDPRMESPDWLALGRHLLRGGRRADGWRALRRAVEAAEGPASALAALLISRTLVRRGRPRSAERLLAALQDRLPAEPGLAAARARLLEWNLREPAAAREVVIAVLERQPASARGRAELEWRLARLERKLARPGGARRDRSAGPLPAAMRARAAAPRLPTLFDP